MVFLLAGAWGVCDGVWQTQPCSKCVCVCLCVRERGKKSSCLFLRQQSPREGSAVLSQSNTSLGLRFRSLWTAIPGKPRGSVRQPAHVRIDRLHYLRCLRSVSLYDRQGESGWIQTIPGSISQVQQTQGARLCSVSPSTITPRFSSDRCTSRVECWCSLWPGICYWKLTTVERRGPESASRLRNSPSWCSRRAAARPGERGKSEAGRKRSIDQHPQQESLRFLNVRLLLFLQHRDLRQKRQPNDNLCTRFCQELLFVRMTEAADF